MSQEQYFSGVMDILKKVQTSAKNSIAEAAEKIVETVAGGHIVYFFGCTHAGILTQEVYYRTGGLVIFNPIFAPGLLVSDSPISMTSELERVDEYGRILAEKNRLEKGDLLFIHSVSGRNGVPVELAQAAREMGLFTIAITSLSTSQSTESRHLSGKRLFEVCDMVIDNGCPVGDALVEVQPGVRAGPASTVVGAAIVNAIVVEAAERFAAAEGVAPVFKSANLDGSGEYNRTLYEKYKDSIVYPIF